MGSRKLQRPTEMPHTESTMLHDRWMSYPGRGLVGLAAAVLALGACEVTNPGPVADAVLDEPQSFEGLVTGMGRDLAEALNWIAYTGAAVSREVHPSGSTGSFGITVQQQLGRLEVDQTDTHWDNAQLARWTSDDGVRRLLAAETTPDPELLAQAQLWAGYANRLLGENMCEAVIDGGAPEPGTVYLQRAEAHFTSAMGTAASGSDIALAAQAGRASVRVHLGDWTGAVADAGAIADGFVYQVPYFAGFGDEQLNRIYFATAGEPYRAHTAWNTVYGDETEAGPPGSYFAFEPNDPRVPWLKQPGEVGDAAIDCCGKVSWWPETKYDAEDSPIALSSSEEMRLIEAEDFLRNSDITNAMAKITALRTAAGVADWPVPADLTEAWTRLKRERGIELWLEGRRLGDLGRWDADGAPGALDPLEDVGAAAAPHGPSHLATRDFCFPIPDSEEQTNPNIP